MSPAITAAWPRIAGHQMEQRLKSGDLRAVVATASLELGIDIGTIDSGSARLARRAESAPSCSASDDPGTRWAARRTARSSPPALDELIECAAMVARRGARRSGIESVSRRRRSRCLRSRLWPSSRRADGRRRALSPRYPRSAVSRSAARDVRGDARHAGQRRGRRRRALRVPSSTATGSTACCVRAARRG